MKIIQQRIPVSLILALVILFPGQLLLGADISFYAIVKRQDFEQTNSTLVSRNEFSFRCFVDSTAPDLITDASVQLPGGGSRTLTPDGSDEYGFEETFSTQSALNAAYGQGVYTVNIDSENDGFSFAQLTMTADNYPTIPQITNFTAAQSINPSNAFTLGWLPFAGGTTTDFIQVEIQTSTGDEVFFSGEPGAPDGLNGTNTFIVIPANTFFPGESYEAKLHFFKFVTVDTTSIPNAKGIVAFRIKTEFFLKTTGSAPAIHLQPIGFTNGAFQFSFNTQPGKNYQIEFADTLPNWQPLAFTNAASNEIIFTDPFAGGNEKRFYKVMVP